MISDKNDIKNISWKRINMRTVEHLIGVEFIHDLYDRHVQRINFIRFRNTITIWKNGTVNSYAPEKDFELLERWFGEKFFILDETVLREFSTLLNSDRVFFNEQVERFENANLPELSNLQLGLLLIDVQQYSLGELYKMNFVQAEYSLTYAIKRILKEEFKCEEKIDEIFSRIITTNIPTESQKEETEFLEILKKKKKKDENINDAILELLKIHFEKYAFMHCAYGEDPCDLECYIEKYKSYDPFTKNKSSEEIEKQINNLDTEGKKILDSLNNPKLNTLVPLMIRGGTFRDKNKASLGYTIKYKYKIFEEIENRKLENRVNLNYYLLSEILNLLDVDIKVDQGVIDKRKIEGVVLVRSEYLSIAENFKVMDLQLPIKNCCNNKIKELKGRCACSGVVEGEAKVVLNKADGVKIKEGNIMISIGTDFDLMDAMHRSAGVVTEEGGLLSHASVVCREMKKTCLIGVKDATNIIKDGDRVILDSKNDKITIL